MPLHFCYAHHTTEPCQQASMEQTLIGRSPETNSGLFWHSIFINLLVYAVKMAARMIHPLTGYLWTGRQLAAAAMLNLSDSN